MNYYSKIKNSLNTMKSLIISSYEKMKDIYNNVINNGFQYIGIGITMSLILLKKSSNSLFLNSLTNDSIFSAINLISKLLITYDVDNIFINKFLKPFKILLPKLSYSYQHKVSIFDRYIYYTIIALTELILKWITWYNYSSYIYHILIFTTQPLIMEACIQLLVDIYDLIYKKINKFKLIIISGSMSYLINLTSKSVLKMDPNINSKELKRTIKKVIDRREYNHIITFLKIFIITNIINYANNSRYIYGKFIELLYNYGALIKINNEYNIKTSYDNIKDPKEKLRTIIKKRDWDQLYNANTLNSIIDIYKINETGELLNIITNNINYCNLQISKFFALYSIATFINNPLISIILSFIILIIEGRKDKFSYMMRIISIILVNFNIDPIYIIGICELTELFNNKLVKWLIINSLEKIYKYRKILFHHNKYNITFILSFIIIQYIDNIYLLSLFVFITKYPLIYSLIIYSNYLSNFDVLHLFVVNFIIYIIVNIIDYKNAPVDTLSLTLINSFLSKSKMYRNITNQQIDISNHIKYDYLDNEKKNRNNKMNNQIMNNQIINNQIINNVKIIDNYL